MNKLIHDLRVQAKDYAAMEHANGVGGIAEFTQLYETKFAELIVRECADFAREWTDDYVVEVTAPRQIGAMIKENFGVKE